jgi:hypothetical protein
VIYVWRFKVAYEKNISLQCILCMSILGITVSKTMPYHLIFRLHINTPSYSGYFVGLPMGALAQGQRFGVTLMLDGFVQAELLKLERRSQQKQTGSTKAKISGAGSSGGSDKDGKTSGSGSGSGNTGNTGNTGTNVQNTSSQETTGGAQHTEAKRSWLPWRNKSNAVQAQKHREHKEHNEPHSPASDSSTNSVTPRPPELVSLTVGAPVSAPVSTVIAAAGLPVASVLPSFNK